MAGAVLQRRVWYGRKETAQSCPEETLICEPGILSAVGSTRLHSINKVSSPEKKATGIVLLHGKPGNGQGRIMQSLRTRLEGDDFDVDTPTMGWGDIKAAYRQPVLEVLQAIDARVATLRTRARRIFVGGFSLGGNLAIAYAAKYQNLDGVVAFAPAHNPDLLKFKQNRIDSLRRARAMVKEGRGTEEGRFVDESLGEAGPYHVEVTAHSYLSWCSDEEGEGELVIPRNTRKLPDIPIFVAVALNEELDRTVRPNLDYLGEPRSPKHELVRVSTEHNFVPTKSIREARAWMDRVASERLAAHR